MSAKPVSSAEADSVLCRLTPALTCWAIYVPPLRGWCILISDIAF